MSRPHTYNPGRGVASRRAWSAERHGGQGRDDPLLKLLGGALVVAALAVALPAAVLAFLLLPVWRRAPWWLPPAAGVLAVAGLGLWLRLTGQTLEGIWTGYLLGQGNLLYAALRYLRAAQESTVATGDPREWLAALAPPLPAGATVRAYLGLVAPLAVPVGVALAAAGALARQWGVGGDAVSPTLRLRSRTSAQLLKLRFRRLPWLFDGYVRLGAITLVYSPPGGGKTEWTMALVAAIASLKPGEEGTFLGRRICGARVYVVSEQTPDTLQDYVVRHRLGEGIARGQVRWVTYEEVRQEWRRRGGEGEPPWEAVGAAAHAACRKHGCRGVAVPLPAPRVRRAGPKSTGADEGAPSGSVRRQTPRAERAGPGARRRRRALLLGRIDRDVCDRSWHHSWGGRGRGIRGRGSDPSAPGERSSSWR
jgi:hypothetical protein